MQPLNLSPGNAEEKIKHFCAYQERCHQETKDKLYSYGLHKPDVERLLSLLIEENYLNEERFAIAYAGGKFRMNHWGKIKIRYALQQKKISDYCIKVALKKIDDEAYMTQIEKLCNEKWHSLRLEKNVFARKKKLMQYMLQKGYESSMVNDWLKTQDS